MFELTRGDLLAADAEAIVNTVNCVGVMGRGIALQMRNAFPDNYRTYAVACERGDVVPGRMFVTETGRLGNPRWIINFPTKRHWKGNSRIEDIEVGLVDLCRARGARGRVAAAGDPVDRRPAARLRSRWARLDRRAPAD